MTPYPLTSGAYPMPNSTQAAIVGKRNVSYCAGLHQGLATLCRAGVPPKLLIIDDGWQMTDVDRKFREPMTTRMIKEQEMLRQMFKDMNINIENSSDEYLEAQVQLLYKGLKDIAPSSSIGELLALALGLAASPASAQCRMQPSASVLY